MQLRPRMLVAQFVRSCIVEIEALVDLAAVLFAIAKTKSGLIAAARSSAFVFLAKCPPSCTNSVASIPIARVLFTVLATYTNFAAVGSSAGMSATISAEAPLLDNNCDGIAPGHLAAVIAAE